MRSSFLVCLLLCVASAHAAPRIIATVSDPVGDDTGGGALIHPQRNDFEAGDLDLVRLQVSRDDDGYWFEATFRNPIRDPANAFGTIGSEPLSNIARKGFYQFNLDIYIDVDRVKNSGNLFTLPGRKASIDPAFAWEKAVILTPRPEAIRSQLLDVLERQFPDRPKGEAAASIDQSMYFPTQVRVRNKSVVFLVPAAFVGDGDARNWAMTAFVTGAKTDIAISLPLLPSGKTPLEDLNLGVLQPAVGRPSETFGYAGGVAPSPIVDLLAPLPDLQGKILSAATVELPGVALNAVTTDTASESAATTARPAAPKAPAWGDPIAAPAAGSVGAAAPTSTPARPTSPVPLQSLLQPGKTPRTPAAPEASPAKRPSIAERLQVLQDLFDKRLISEAEYKQQRLRILNEL